MGDDVRRVGARLPRRHERRRDHPEQREDRDHRAGDEQRVDPHSRQDAPVAAAADLVAHASAFTKRRWIIVAIAMMMKRTKAIDAAKPIRHQRNPSSYM